MLSALRNTAIYVCAPGNLASMALENAPSPEHAPEAPDVRAAGVGEREEEGAPPELLNPPTAIATFAPERFAVPVLSIPATGRVGHQMHRAAISQLCIAREQGANWEQLADLYDQMKDQIEKADRDWTADRAVCGDGSHFFLGTLGYVLLIMSDRSVLTGRIGHGELIDTSIPGKFDSTTRWRYAPPNLTARHRRY